MEAYSLDYPSELDQHSLFDHSKPDPLLEYSTCSPIMQQPHSRPAEIPDWPLPPSLFSTENSTNPQYEVSLPFNFFSFNWTRAHRIV